MDELFRAIEAVVALVLQVIAAVIIWLLMGIYLCVYYTVHPHPEYREYLF